MIIRQEFKETSNMPPREFMDQIMDTVSKVYCFLWDNKDDEREIGMGWHQLSRYYNRNSFRSSLRKLNDRGLLSFRENEDGFWIQLVGWDEIDNDEK